MGPFTEFVKQAALPVGKMLSKARGPLIGAGAGAAGMYGLSHLGEGEIKKRQEAEELRQLLEEYPELLLTTPSPYESQEGA
jgi:hypothetical protein